MVGSVAWPHLNLASKRQSENGVAEVAPLYKTISFMYLIYEQ